MRNLCFGSGPCGKRQGWSLSDFSLLGRSHRSKDGLKLIQKVINLHRKILHIPDDYLIGILTGSSTGAMEILIWNLIDNNGTDVINHCVFSNHWENDIVKELKVKNVRSIFAPFPKMADISKVDFSRDVVFCLSSTTSGVAFRDLNWIPENRKGLTICDAASGAFIIDIDWKKLDATSFSWQKGIGGEAGFGVIVLSLRAVQRIENSPPTNRAIPRLFRIAPDGKLNSAFFEGSTINTPSMLCMQECYENLLWVEKSGGMFFMTKTVEQNYNTVTKWISSQNIFKFLVEERFRAHHIACLDINTETYQNLSTQDKWTFLKKIIEKSEEKKYGYDFIGHFATEPHIRIWCGPTINSNDLDFFLHKLTELYLEVQSEYGKN